MNNNVKVVYKSQIGDVIKRFQTAVDKGLTESAIIVDAEAKQNAPVITGRLRASITYTVDKDKGFATVGTNVVYAKSVEFERGKNKKGRFLLPALTKKKKEIEFLINRALREAIK